jgi:hypothetical protein
VRDHVSHPYKTTGKIIVLCTLTCCPAHRVELSTLWRSKTAIIRSYSP